MKRLIAIILTLFTLASALSSAVLAEAAINPETGMPFTDVKTSHWFYDAVRYTYENGIFSANNSAGDKFAPNASLTRAMFVTVLFRLSGADQSAYTGNTVFTDVSPKQWYAKAVQWANEKGYVAGMTPTTFDPNGKITRAQMARILSLYAAGEDGYDITDVRSSALAKFSDASKVQSWAAQGMTWMCSTELMSGMGTKNGAPILNPNGNATRAQAAVLLKGYMEYHNGEYPVGSLTLEGADISEFSIVYGETSFNLESEDCSAIAQFIYKQFRAALGIELPVYRDTEHPYVKGAKEILVGKTDREGSAVSVDREGINHNTYIYEMKGDFLILASDEEMYATYYAATMFLEDILGITYYGLDRFGYTNMKTASLDDGVRVSESMDFDYCSNFQYGGEDYFLGTFGEGVFVNASHNLNALGCIDPDCPYAEKDTISYAHHLEHYLKADPCLTDDNVIDRIIENVRANLEEELGDNKDAYAHVWLNQDDLGDYCKGRDGCDCAKVYSLWGRSAPYVQIMTYVSEALTDEYPNVRYFSFSYKQTAAAPKTADEISDAEYEAFVESFKDHKYIPPKDITPPANCTVMVKTDDTGCSSHDRGDASCEKNKKYISRFEGWCEIFDSVCMHHFMTSDKYPTNPFPNIYELWSDFDFLCNYPEAKAIRVGANFHEDSTDFQGMRAYLSSKLYWNKDMTWAEYSDMLDGYLKDVYGDGWTYIREYIDTMEELSSEQHFWTYGDQNDWYEIITEEQWRDGNFEYMKSLLYTALELAHTEEQAREAEILTLCIDYIECQLAYRAGADNFPTLSTAFTEKQTRLGYENPENWAPDLNPDEWIY